MPGACQPKLSARRGAQTRAPSPSPAARAHDGRRRRLRRDQRRAGASRPPPAQDCGEHLQAARGKEAQLKRAARRLRGIAADAQSLPERVEHRVMVPFGKMAFFPGSLRHTNEITVLLGDNYFALRSAAQAEGIAERRADFVRPQLDEAKEEVAELERTREKLRAIGALHAEQQGTFEIREEYVEEEWAAKAAAARRRHRARRGGRRRQKGAVCQPGRSRRPRHRRGANRRDRRARSSGRRRRRRCPPTRRLSTASSSASITRCASAAPPPRPPPPRTPRPPRRRRTMAASPRVSRFKAARMRSRGGGADG